MTDKEIEELLKDLHNDEKNNLVRQMILLRFPNIKNLEVSGEGDSGRIKFDDDGIHTKEMVEEYIQKTIMTVKEL